MYHFRHIYFSVLMLSMSAFSTGIFAQGQTVFSDSLHKSTISNGLEIPALKTGEKIIRHAGYALVYAEPHEQASWVAYELTQAETVKSFERTDHFVTDPLVSTGTADNKDYEKCGYDRGHLAPAADMGWSQVAVAESFYFSNMSPQLPGFNRGIWKKLEERVRDWAIENGTLYIVTGPVLTPGLPTIGLNGVSVPALYYKVLLDYTAPEVKSIAFLIPNAASDQPLTDFVVTIDSVEMLTGIDFFPLLPDAEEVALEKSVCTACWDMKTGKPAAISAIETNTKPKKATTVVCKGKTKAGKPCKQKTTYANGRCYQHGGK